MRFRKQTTDLPPDHPSAGAVVLRHKRYRVAEPDCKAITTTSAFAQPVCSTTTNHELDPRPWGRSKAMAGLI
jgi:hypothetical protein